MAFLQGAQWYLKSTAATRMKEETLITISVPVAAVHWEEKENEIKLNGKMFDIKSFWIANGMLTATGYYDDIETEIIDLLLTLPQDSNNNILLHFFLVLQCFTVSLVWFGNVAVYRHSRLLPTASCLILSHPLRFIPERPPSGQ
ncbi:MAG: hypothetical protein M3Q06_09300 [Bacteroidota bacterium]|nr:hypothetical protein [Bacteroidota bacterium]